MTAATATRRTILVVEDDAALRRVIVRSLWNHGFIVIDACDAEQGLTLHQDAAPLDLAVIDMVLPQMSGLDLALELERRQPGLKVLYISGHVDSIAMESIALRSPESLMLKPFRQRELVDRIRRLLDLPRQRVLGSASFPQHLSREFE